MRYEGIIIEESLDNKDVLDDVEIISAKIEEVTREHNTPYLEQWTLHTVQIPEDRAAAVAEKLSKSLDAEHGDWYADFKNDRTHYIIFREKVFKVNRSKPEEYKAAVEYGQSLGIPDHQLDFSPDIEQWER